MSQGVQELREQEPGGQEFEEQVRQRAYQLWEQEGRPEARSDEFWFRAKQDLQGAQGLAETSPASENADMVELESDQSFPASDPPSFTSTRGPA